jgi:hypothetical protein
MKKVPPTVIQLILLGRWHTRTRIKAIDTVQSNLRKLLYKQIVATEGSTTQSTEYVEYTAKRQVLGGLHLAQGTDRQGEQCSSSTLPRFSKNSVSK